MERARTGSGGEDSEERAWKWGTGKHARQDLGLGG